jgi:hypothetical protein
MAEFLPLELVFNPNWWHKTAGVCFDSTFYLDPQTRIRNDVLMRRTLYARFGSLGLGERDPQPRPLIGSRQVAGGFVIPALLGAEIRFAADAAPQPLPRALTPAQVEALEKPDFRQTWPMSELIEQMDALEQSYGSLVGDFDLDGLLNTAYALYGQSLYADFFDAPARLVRFLELIADLMVEVGRYVRQRSGTCAIATNRMAAHVDPGLFIHSNCSVPMISPRSYQQLLLPIEVRMAERTRPYGIHHCGSNLQDYAPHYARSGAVFYDVGWGSDVARCRKALPEAFFSLRLSPVRMLQCTPAEIAADTDGLLRCAGPLDKAGVCCINIDYGTPDDNIFALAGVIERYRRYGA